MLKRTMVLVCVLVLAGAAAHAAEVTLGANADLDGGANLGSIAQSGGDGSRGNPWVYGFTPGSGGLDLGSYKVYTDQTLPSSVDSDSFKLDLGGERVVGNSGVTAFSTYSGPGAGADSGYLYLVNVGDIACGTIDTSGEANKHYSTSSTAGRIYIGEATGTGAGPAGNIRVDNLYAHQRTVYAESNAAEDGNGNNIYIYGSGDVLIETSGGTLGVVQTFSYRETSGLVAIRHDGEFRAERVDTRAHGRQTSGGNSRSITLNGDYLGDGASGACTVNNLWAYYDRTSYGDPNEDITISGYTSLTVGDVLTYHSSAANWDNYGGDVWVSGIEGDITINGTVNLNSAHSAAADGRLELECDGTIYLNAGLDLSKMLYASFDPGPATTEILDAIIGSDGNPADGTNIANLRTPFGDVIYYDPDPALNPALGGATFTLADLGGTAGLGGTLEPMGAGGMIPEPAGLAVMVFGLALLGRRRR